MSSLYCIAWKCVNGTAGLLVVGICPSSHILCLPLQRPQYEQHQSAAPECPAQPPLPRRVVSITVVLMCLVNTGYLLVLVSHACCGNQIKQGREAVSTNHFGT